MMRGECLKPRSVSWPPDFEVRVDTRLHPAEQLQQRLVAKDHGAVRLLAPDRLWPRRGDIERLESTGAQAGELTAVGPDLVRSR